MRFTVAIIGRPNVGKSTLFNRLVGKRLALVDDLPGVTRDRREGEARLGDLRFTVVDTAGLEEADPTTLTGRMRAQTEAAIRAADLVLFLIDARTGITPVDVHFADLLRRIGGKVILVANKAEGDKGEVGALEAYELGLGEPIAISAEHGEGLADLYRAVAAFAPSPQEPTDEELAGAAGSEEEAAAAEAEAARRPVRIAVVGRPNAGKSTLVNRLIGEERMLTGAEAGITRDAIEVDWRWRDRQVKLIDTAGLRRRARVQEKLEKLSVADALRAVRFAEVVVILLDAEHPFEQQDLKIADLVESEGRACVIAVNKWDLVEERGETLKALREAVDRLLPQLAGVALIPVSALTGAGLEQLMNAVIAAHGVWNRRIATSRLNRWLEEMVERHPPPAVAGRRVRLRYMTQPKSRPPTFIVFCSRPEALPDAYRRYLVNGLREAFELPGTPIRLHLRKGENPYAGRR